MTNGNQGAGAARRATQRQWLGAWTAFLGTSALYLQLATTTDTSVVGKPEPLVVTPVRYVQTAMRDDDDLTPFAFPESTDAAYIRCGDAIEGEAGLRRSIALIEAGIRHVQHIPDYTGVFSRQERIDGLLKEPENIELKIRHAPFSIYLNWLDGPDRGREVLFADGQNEGEMIYHAGGWKGRLLPPLKLNPHGKIALSHSRHPVTDLGLVAIAKRTIHRRESELAAGGRFRFHLEENAEFDDRPAILCQIEFHAPNGDEPYRKSIYWIDRELLVPVAMQNYGWPSEKDIPADRLDEETLLEDYAFTQLRWDRRLAEVDFDTRNSSYHFRR